MTRLVVERPEKLSVELTDSTFTMVTQPGSVILTLPITGKQTQRGNGADAYKAKLRRKDGMPVVERSLDSGGKVVDTFELLSRDRLMLTRTVQGGPAKRELRLVYDRQTDG